MRNTNSAILNADEDVTDEATLVERLVSYAGAIVAAERTRRGMQTK